MCKSMNHQYSDSSRLSEREKNSWPDSRSEISFLSSLFARNELAKFLVPPLFLLNIPLENLILCGWIDRRERTRTLPMITKVLVLSKK